MWEIRFFLLDRMPPETSMILTFYVLGKKNSVKITCVSPCFFFINVRQKIPSKNKKSTFIKKKYSKKKTSSTFFYRNVTNKSKNLIVFQFWNFCQNKNKKWTDLNSNCEKSSLYTFLSKKTYFNGFLRNVENPSTKLVLCWLKWKLRQPRLQWLHAPPVASTCFNMQPQ